MSAQESIFSPDEKTQFCSVERIISMKNFIIGYEIFAVVAMLIIIGVSLHPCLCTKLALDHNDRNFSD